MASTELSVPVTEQTNIPALNERDAQEEAFLLLSRFMGAVAGHCYEDALLIAEDLLRVDPSNALIQEYQQVLRQRVVQLQDESDEEPTDDEASSASDDIASGDDESTDNEDASESNSSMEESTDEDQNSDDDESSNSSPDESDAPSTTQG
ncbi:hypothetical protein BC832DRAFT_539568 [Gaertneriomyces semiglobifer]|nr:hypothetical protein BC832DRAFT_539568 [Gaertneriomyces semiglobifer]